MAGVNIIAPDERDAFRDEDGEELGPRVTENTDSNGDYLPGTPDDKKGKSTSQEGNWNTFQNGQMTKQQDGGSRPGQSYFWSDLFN